MEQKNTPTQAQGLTVGTVTATYVRALRSLVQAGRLYLDAHTAEHGPTFDLEQANPDLYEHIDKAREIIQAVIVDRAEMYAEAVEEPEQI
jgi:hypothetical protein